MKNRYLLKKGIALSVAVSITASMAIGTGTAYAAEPEDSAVVQQADEAETLLAQTKAAKEAAPDEEVKVVNGDFETIEEGTNRFPGWKYESKCDAVAQLEERTENHVAYDEQGEFSQEINLTPNRRYKVTARFKANEKGKAKITIPTGGIGIEVANKSADVWETMEASFTAPSNGKILLRIRAWIGYLCWFDDVKITEIPTDFSRLNEAIEKFESKESEKELYTEDSWAACVEMRDRAEQMLADEEAFQTDVDAAVMALNSAIAGLVLASPEGANVYYIDSKDGNDSADGLSPETAWKSLEKVGYLRLDAGDQVLLKAGSVWNGEKLTINQAKGSEEAKVVIGKYGEGALPILNGQGANWNYSRKEELATVHVFNSSNIIVENLEVTNYDETADNYGNGIIPESDKLLSAIVVEGRDAGQLENITIRNNVVHDVNGRMTGGTNKSAGGIIFYVNGTDFSNPENKTWFDNISIVGNDVYDVCHEAIYMQSLWGKRPLVAEGDGEWVGWDNVYVAHNYVHHTAGDGIVIINTKNAVAEYNLLDGVANEDYTAGGNPAHAGLWCWDANNVVMQYNEVCNTESKKDGMAFDFDYGVQNSIYQYNYTHNNKGGFFMVCPSPWGATVNCVGRYNVSVNDGGFDGTRILRFGGQNSYGIQFYNNTVYWADSVGENIIVAEKGTWDGGDSRGTRIFNNILYGLSQQDAEASWPVFATNGVTYDNNCVWGGCETVYQALNLDENAVVADPQFVDTKGFTTGSFANHEVTLGSVDGFKLKATSPCIGKGTEIPNAPQQNEDITIRGKKLLDDYVTTPIQKPEKDYYGNLINLSAPNMGAYAGAGEAEALDTTALADKINEVRNIDEAKYTEESVAEYRKAVAAVLRVTELMLNNPSATTQEDVDAAVENLQSVYDRAKEKLVTKESVKEELRQGIENISQNVKEEKLYTPESYKAYADALKNAQDVLEDAGITQTEAATALADLQTAADALVEKQALVEKARLQAWIEKVDALLKSGQSFTADSQKAAEEALAAAVAVSENVDADTYEVKQAWIDLMNAFLNLTNGSVKDGLVQAIATARTILEDPETEKNYTAESIQGVKDALAAAEEVDAKEDAPQEEINDATNALIDAVTQLLEKDYTQLRALIKQAEEILKNEDRYTPSSVQSLKEAVAEAQKLVDDKSGTTETISQAGEDILAAIAELQLRGNKDELASLMKKAEEILGQPDQYLAQTLEGLQEAYDQAKAVYENDDAVQAAITEATVKLINECMEVRILGDVDLNGIVEQADSRLMLQYSAELTGLTDEQVLVGDINGDGKTDTLDASEVLVKVMASEVE